MGMAGNRSRNESSERRMRWEMFRSSRLEKLNHALERGEVDRELTGLIESINSRPDCVTLSSCSGRIGIIDLPEFGDKKNAVFRGKWHHEVTPEAIATALKLCSNEGWLKVEPPIIHLAVSSLEMADSIVKSGLRAGFKRSCILSVSEWKAVVEITSTEVLESLLSLNGRILVSPDYIEILTDRANKKLERGMEKLRRLERELNL